MGEWTGWCSAAVVCDGRNHFDWMSVLSKCSNSVRQQTSNKKLGTFVLTVKASSCPLMIQMPEITLLLSTPDTMTLAKAFFLNFSRRWNIPGGQKQHSWHRPSLNTIIFPLTLQSKTQVNSRHWLLRTTTKQDQESIYLLTIQIALPVSSFMLVLLDSLTLHFLLTLKKNFPLNIFHIISNLPLLGNIKTHKTVTTELSSLLNSV